MNHSATLRTYRGLFARYGAQQWWPADSRFEVMLGAVLTQNTAWRNVELALDALRAAGLFDADALVRERPAVLARLIRPSGCFNVKTQRIKALSSWYLERGGYKHLRHLSTAKLRAELLAVRGIGPETADAILLYAFGRPVCVIDAYTRRVFARLGEIGGDENYDFLSKRIGAPFASDAKALNEFHALLVYHAKVVCRSKPLCRDCCLLKQCRHGLAAA